MNGEIIPAARSWQGRPLQVQGRVLLHNLVAMLSAVGPAILKSLWQSIVKSVGHLAARRTRGLRFRLAGALVGISADAAKCAFESFSDGDHGAKSPPDRPGKVVPPGAPVASQEPVVLSASPGALVASQEPVVLSASQRARESDKVIAMKNIIRTAIAAGVEGLSFSAYERLLHRMRLASALVGNRYQDSGAPRVLHE